MGPVGGGGESEIVNEEQVANLFISITRALGNVRQVFEQQGHQTCGEFVDELKFRIASQSFNHVALNVGYKQGKIRARLDPRILIATGEYLNSIMYEQLEETGPDVAFICGVRRGTHQPSGLPVHVLARIMEYGAVRQGRRVIPPRPHWRPMFATMRERAHEIGLQTEQRINTMVRENL